MRAFWEPAITISRPHSSVLRSKTPRPVIASTTSIVSSYLLTISAIALVLWATPVEVSLAWIYTAFIEGSFFKAASTLAGSTA